MEHEVASKPAPKSSVRRVLILFASAYLVLCLCALVWQRRLIYFPTIIPANLVEQVGAEHGFVPWRNAVGGIIGWKIPADGVATGSVLIMHGNAGSAVGRDYIAQPIHQAAPVDVYVLEYPGYGARTGSPSKTSMVAAADEAFDLMPAGKPKYLVSESIGTGVSCELAKAHPNEVAGMVLFVPYHSLASVAQRHMWFLPCYLFLLDRFDPEECLKQYRGPVKFAIAGADEVLGPATGMRLAEGYQGRKDVQVFPGAHHNDVSGEPPEWWRTVFKFWETNKI